MNIKTTSIISILLLVPVQSFAHEGAAHTGKAIYGTVTSVSADSFNVSTDQGPMTIEFSEKTTFEHHGKPVTSAHLKAAEAVEVHGPKLPGGKVGAEEVLIGVHNDSAHSDENTSGGKMPEAH